jgi:hypothetical protein
VPSELCCGGGRPRSRRRCPAGGPAPGSGGIGGVGVGVGVDGLGGLELDITEVLEPVVSRLARLALLVVGV